MEERPTSLVQAKLSPQQSYHPQMESCQDYIVIKTSQVQYQEQMLKLTKRLLNCKDYEEA